MSITAGGIWGALLWITNWFFYTGLWRNFCVVPMYTSFWGQAEKVVSWMDYHLRHRSWFCIHNWHSSFPSSTTHSKFTLPLFVSLEGLSPYLVVESRPPFLCGVRFFWSGVAVFLHSQLQWGKEVPGGIHVSHLESTHNSSLPPLCKSHPASSRKPGSITLSKMMSPLLTF